MNTHYSSKVPYLYTLVALVAGITLGHYVFPEKPHPHRGVGHEERGGRTEASLTNPLLECELAEDYITDGAIRPFKGVIAKEIESLIAAKKATHISYYFRDLNNGAWFGFNEKETFQPASLFKVPLLMYTLREAEQNPQLLDTQIKIEHAAEANQFIHSQSVAEVGTMYSIAELASRLILHSDNNAALALVTYFGEEKVQTIFTDLGVDVAMKEEDASISVRDYGTFFRILFNASYLNQEMSEKALTLLTETEFDSGIVGGVPDEVKVAHKFGERGGAEVKQLHDCGIVYSGSSPYLLCVMTRGSSFLNLSHVIKELSASTYNQVKSQKSL